MTHQPGRAARRGFTLIELLVVIAIIGILAGFLLPALLKSKDRGYAVQCSNNIKQLSTALRKYCMLYDDYFPVFGSGPDDLYPVEQMVKMLGSANYRLSGGGAAAKTAPKYVFCPACRMAESDGADYACRNYAYNSHLDSKTPNDAVLTRVKRTVFPAGEKIWPQLGGAGTATFQPMRMGSVSSPSNVAAFMDSSDQGSSKWGWYLNSSTIEAGNVPNRHLSGGNIGYLDGHTDYHDTLWLLDVTHEPQWLCGGSTGDSGEWSK